MEKKSIYVPAREMGPRELLKSSSTSFGRADDWVMNWGSSRPPAFPSALGARSSGEHRMVGVPCWVRLSGWIQLRVALPNS